MKKEALKKYLATNTIGVIEAMQLIDLNSKGLLFIVDEADRLQGTVTDGDIRRWIIKTGNLNGVVSSFMNKNPKYLYRKDIKTAKGFMKQKGIKALPILNNQNKIYDILFESEEETDIYKKESKILSEIPLVIMAGGKGTRLYPYTKILPKPLIPIGDIPIMERIINSFAEYGIQSCYTIVNYRKNMIISYFNEQQLDMNIKFVEEDEPLGTAGGLKLIENIPNCPFFLTNCDVLINTDYADIYKHHIESENDITMVVAMKNIVVPYGVIHSQENGIISSIEEKPRMSYFVNTGMYVLNPDVLKYIPEKEFYHMTDLTEYLIANDKRVGMYPISEDSFLDMGEFEEMRRMEEKLNLNSNN